MKRTRSRMRSRAGREFLVESLEDRVVLSGIRMIGGLPYDHAGIARAVNRDTAIINRAAQFLGRNPGRIDKINVGRVAAAKSDLSQQIDRLKANRDAVERIVNEKVQAIKTPWRTRPRPPSLRRTIGSTLSTTRSSPSRTILAD